MRTSPTRVKVSRTLIAIAALAIAQAAGAVDIHKCALGAGISYQTAPCAAGQPELAVAPWVAAAARAGRIDAPPAHAADPSQAPMLRRTPQWRPFARRTLAPGMSDDEVLNTPDGGVPTRIARTRAHRAWREVWTYALPDGGVRALTFENGTLMRIDDDRTTPLVSLRLAAAAN
jgi:hypothetical protein